MRWSRNACGQMVVHHDYGTGLGAIINPFSAAAASFAAQRAAATVQPLTFAPFTFPAFPTQFAPAPSPLAPPVYELTEAPVGPSPTPNCPGNKKWDEATKQCCETVFSRDANGNPTTTQDCCSRVRTTRGIQCCKWDAPTQNWVCERNVAGPLPPL